MPAVSGNYEFLKVADGLDPRISQNNHLSFLEWIDKYYRLPVSNRAPGGQLVFSDRPYLWDLYKCDSQYIVVMKAAQVGMSERFIAEMFYCMDRYRMNVLYTFPAAEQIGNFVSGRVNPVIECSPYIQSLMTGTKYQKDDIGMKSVGGRFAYFRGSQNRNQIITIDADLLVIDERDSMVQNNVDAIKKRVLSSYYQWIRELSTPSYEDFGIHVSFQNSDQRQWFIKCPKCGKEQTLRFPQSFHMDPPTDGYWCDKHGCDGKLDPLAGKWIATNPQSEIAGFHVPGMLNPRTSAIQLIKKYNDPNTNVMEFHWQDLGNPYNPADAKMTRDILNACRATEEDVLKDTGNHCRMGVDVGKVLHIRISEKVDDKLVARYIGTVQEFEDLDSLMSRYDVDCCVIDALPETRKAKEFAAKFRGRVYLAYYNLKGADLFKFEDKVSTLYKQIPEVRINRTQAIDSMYAQIESRQQVLPRNLDAIEDFYDQICAMTKVPKLNANTGNIEYHYVGGTVDEHGKPSSAGKPDHYAHASVYELIAWQAQAYRAFRKLKPKIL